MTEPDDEATFTFSWLALRLLGRGLYSNPWSALSELVANGLDAGADNVYVYVNAVDKANAVVEVIDDGSGMSRYDITTYVKVGHNKRKEAQSHGVADTSNIKGRKGIGKLAALFLSQHFYLQTRHTEGASDWELDARDENVSDDDYPKLIGSDSVPTTENDSLWAGLESGTRLVLLDVDLTGYGPQSMAALGSRLANQFLLPRSSTPKILLWVRTSPDETEPGFQQVQKSIAFGNFAELAQNFSDETLQPVELVEPPTTVEIPAKGLPGDVYEHVPVRSSFPLDPPQDEAWAEIEEDVDPSNRTYRGIKYELTGWIGAHATIDNEAAQKNDDRFVKNRYYNPAQIRVYVRGKLASDRLLSQLGITGTYANYIEGEISFDLLDEDSLPDIATSNRQDFDETDNRVTLLRALVRPIVRSLIQRRNNLASKINAEVAEEKQRREDVGKRNFTDQIQDDFAQHPEIPEEVRDDLVTVISNKLQGDAVAKEKYRVFISHSSADKPFAIFIDEVLRARGAREDEIFFTSRPGDTQLVMDDRSLGVVIKENITDANTLIFYLTSRNFLESQFCLFEGGAGWATRAVSEYLKLNVDFQSIPPFLTNGKGEVELLIGGTAIELTLDLHNYLIDGIFNRMIAHLNRGREVAGETVIDLFTRPTVPSAVEMKKLGKSHEDYFDSQIKQHWGVIVADVMPQYLSAYLGAPDSS